MGQWQAVVNTVMNLPSSIKRRDFYVYPLSRRILLRVIVRCTKVYPKVAGLAAWSENYKWYSSLLLGAVVLLFCESL
jgi:hypothetical protein